MFLAFLLKFRTFENKNFEAKKVESRSCEHRHCLASIDFWRRKNRNQWPFAQIRSGFVEKIGGSLSQKFLRYSYDHS